MSSKTQGIKDSIGTLLVYYYVALQEEGCSDPRQEIATVLPGLIGLSKAQAAYVMDRIGDNTIDTMVEDILVILEGMAFDAREGRVGNPNTIEVVRDSLLALRQKLGSDKLDV